jgi:tetratricopeptide (TPR) repeat protein
MPESQGATPGPKRGLLSRLPQFLKKRPAGDVIAAEVGEGARGVATGKNIIQIGTLQVPIWAVLALLAGVAAAIALLAWIAFRPPQGPATMSGLFNVAVADFGMLDSRGQVSSSQTGDLLSRRLYEGLQIEFNSLPKDIQQNFQPQVWQDSMDQAQKGVKIGMIPGSTPDDQEKAACALAERIHARIVIYGNLPASAATTDFIPQVAVCNNSQLRIDADEIVGGHPVGAGVPARLLAQLSDPNVETSVNIKLNAWSNTFSAFTIGVMYDLQGRSDLALSVFQQAQNEVKSDTGKDNEVIWFFIGREYLLLNQDDQAEKAFLLSIAANAHYARAHLGLGTVYEDHAQALAPVQRATTPDLGKAVAQYQQALQEASSSPGALVGVKASLGLATTSLLEGEMKRDQGNLSGAAASFQAALQEASTASQTLADAKEFRSLAQAYLTTGQAYHELAHLKLQMGDRQASQGLFNQAILSYQHCIDQQAASPADAVLGGDIVENLCIPDQKAAQDALDQLRGGTP